MTARILVVDDSPTIRKVVASILEGHGYDTLPAGDGLEALSVLEAEPVDLVLLDFVMPRMNGFQLCREIRSRPPLALTPVILMSAKGDKIRGRFLQQTGAIDAITKPFDARGLLAVIEGSLKKHLSGRNVSSAPPPLMDGDSEGNEDAGRPSLADAPRDTEAAQKESARQIGHALSRLVAPSLVTMPELTNGAGDRVLGTLAASMTPEVVKSLLPAFRTWEATFDSREVLAGNLSVVSIAEVLQLLQLQRQSGSLFVRSRGAEVVLCLRDGGLDLARSRGLRDEFLLGRYLVADGAITRETLELVVKGNTARRPLGERLMELALITEHQLRRALERQTSELVYELVRWQVGRFAFNSGADPVATQLGLQLPVGALVMEGFRRVDEWRLIEGTFDFDEVLFRDNLAIDRLGEGDLTAQERTVLDAIDGERTVREIIAETEGSSFELSKILFQFIHSRLVRRKAA